MEQSKKSKKRIIYLIYASRQGMGGHYRSCLETAKKCSISYEITIVSIGKNPSPFLLQSDMPYMHIQYESFIRSLRILNKIINDLQPEIIHSFDISSFLFGRMFSKREIRYVHTKCGGPIAKQYYPLMNSLVVYTLEDYKYFKEHSKFKNTEIYFLPNRVNEDDVTPSKENVEIIKNEMSKKDIIFMRIARIGGAYKKSIQQSIRLVTKLNEMGINAGLVVIGSVEDQYTYLELKSLDKKNVFFYTDKKFTIDGAKNIGAADFIIGTGRGFMEGALAGKVMLAPTKNNLYPELVTKKNFEHVFGYNFSGRHETDKTDDELFHEVEKSAKEYLTGKEFNPNMAIKTKAKEYFSSKIVAHEMDKIYKKSKKLNNLKIDLLKNLSRFYKGILYNKLNNHKAGKLIIKTNRWIKSRGVSRI